MKHGKKGKKLSRERNQRRALLKTMLGSLIMHEKITTTEAKAKELKRLIDPIINQAKKSLDEKKKVNVIRELRTKLPLMAVKKITGNFINRFNSRRSGYTRLIKIAPRKNDAAKMAIIEFID
ncbi:MAG: 50S ribosomal protein L17 [Candidatus Moranbacteria bacterium]|nr:50S ribosomal protein L17 [Candidatus Moranbacteria bacterium]